MPLCMNIDVPQYSLGSKSAYGTAIVDCPPPPPGMRVRAGRFEKLRA